MAFPTHQPIAPPSPPEERGGETLKKKASFFSWTRSLLIRSRALLSSKLTLHTDLQSVSDMVLLEVLSFRVRLIGLAETRRGAGLRSFVNSATTHSAPFDVCPVSCKESMNTFLNLKCVNRNGTGPSLPRKPRGPSQTLELSKQDGCMILQPETDRIKMLRCCVQRSACPEDSSLLLTNELNWIARDADPDTDNDKSTDDESESLRNAAEPAVDCVPDICM
ncbi:hypothetical protein BLNAU_24632 [Blattamonas nauphoetae]|uniref:Uncharacterized protein n=1 Tax=Blattamonas nauphoetae TaxID=2049346 RepID=A0ABQ9WLW5_9EUKA|nr:hypothetical protein BLNAU_24632 [Blattamonas nauphoetae]